MTEGETILKMIETVDPADTAKLDEIDARVWCYWKGHPFLRFWHDYSAWGPTVEHELPEAEWELHRLTVDGYRDFKTTQHPMATFKYTRSRDVLKSIRPEGWTFDICWHKDGIECLGSNGFDLNNCLVRAYSLPTEELAELHAIIQAIAYERDVALSEPSQKVID